MEAISEFVGFVVLEGAGLAVGVHADADTDSGRPDQSGESDPLPGVHTGTSDATVINAYGRRVTTERMTIDEAAAIAASGDVWLFTGRKLADRAIRAATNSPVNHVAMVLAIDDLPPLLWHAELGQSVTDVWTGRHHRGAQLHRLVEAVDTWVNRYGQTAYFRQVDPVATPEMEDAALAVVDEYNGRSFPTTAGLVKHWVTGRARRGVSLEDLYCAELVAVTYERMGLLDDRRPVNWYDPGKFWSGDRLQLLDNTSLGPEIAVDVPSSHAHTDVPGRRWHERVIPWR